MKTLQIENQLIHIVGSPEEIEHLKKSNGDQSFQCFLHGSPEHVSTLRRARDAHNCRVQEFRSQNADLFNQMDHFQREMDALSKDLDKVTSLPVELQANFDQFGYSAGIRTYDPGDNERITNEDENPVAMVSTLETPPERHFKERKSTTMKIWKKPVLRQYFHHDILYRAKCWEEVASCELFVDLLYVGIIAFNGDKATEDPTGNGLLRFCVTLIPSWKIWSDLAMLVSQFESDDVAQRGSVLFILVCLLGYTTNIVAAFDTTYSQLIAFYLAARIFVAVTTLWIGFLLPHIRPIMTLNFVTIICPIGLWIGSLFVDEPNKEILIWLAIAWDLFGNVISVFLIRGSMIVSPEFHQRMLRIFAYYPAVNIEHKTERTGSFVSLVLGYSVVALLYQNQATFGMNAFFGKAVLGLLQAYCFNWMYFDIDNAYFHKHALRRHAISSSIWMMVHLVFIMSFTLSAAALSRLVVAHDCRGADPLTLTLTYQAKSEGELADGLRWFYCCGLGVAFICMGLISASHLHTPLETQRLRKRVRLAFRFTVAVIWICLPLATRLNSLQLIGTTTALTILALAVDIYGVSCKQDSLWGGGECKYERKLPSGASGMRSATFENEKAEGVCNYLAKTA